MGKNNSYFEGWYLKHQNRESTIAFIPGMHRHKEGKAAAFIQVITEEGAWYIEYPVSECTIDKKHFFVKIGENIFCEKGVSIDIHTGEICISGKINYSKFHKIHGDIMGIFRFVPFMQCRHGVLSMSHELKGSLRINGTKVDFNDGRGYIETDRGTSFPKKYLWTQCIFGQKGQNSIMASAADIPFIGGRFTGCICAICYEGKEYRIATYYGARLKQYEKGCVVLKQGKMLLKITQEAEDGFELRAPSQGDMARMIKESPSCRVRYELYRGKNQVFEVVSEQASFEQVN